MLFEYILSTFRILGADIFDDSGYNYNRLYLELEIISTNISFFLAIGYLLSVCD